MDSWHSYSSIYAIGHRAIQALLSGDVNVEEKIDGSQFSFQVTEEGEIKVRSKGAVMIADAPEKMFQRAVDTVKELALTLKPGWTYRAEYLAKPKHNTLVYKRIPTRHLIVFEGSPRDIGALMKEIPADIEKECRDEILEALWEWAWPKIRRGVIRGVPEWYKELLLKQAFEEKTDASV